MSFMRSRDWRARFVARPVPVCNRFERAATADTLVNLDIVECETCQLIQLRETPPLRRSHRRLPWIRYREPEGHLDALADALLALRPQRAHRARRRAVRAAAAVAASPRAAFRPRRSSSRPPRQQGRYPYLETWQASLNARTACGQSRRSSEPSTSSPAVISSSTRRIRSARCTH